jgi:glycosyltransferase involved in cell wall biosynthesis
MRILVIASGWFADRKGGSARVATETAERLARRGHEVTVLAPRVRDEPTITRTGSLTLCRTIPRRVIPATLSDMFTGWRHGQNLARDVDLVVSHASTVSCGFVARGLARPLVIVYHAPGPRELQFDSDRLSGVARLRMQAVTPLVALSERISINRAERLLTLSDYTRKLLLADFPAVASRVRRVEGGVDVDEFHPGSGQSDARERLGVDPSSTLLLTVRRLEPRMGLENLLEAVAELRARVPLTLAVGGTGSLERNLHGLAESLGLQNVVRFLGAIPETQLVDWYRAADLFVLPTVEFEGFGMVTVEALASGTPVVGTPVGATPELLAPLEPRLLARDSSPASVGEAIERALELADDALRTRCRTYACERFAWEHVIDDWEAELLAAAA